MKELQAFRDELNEVNLKLLRLLEERGTLVRRVAEFKRSRGVKLHDPQREESMLTLLCAQSRGVFSDDEIREIFGRIFAASRSQGERAERNVS